MVILKESKRDDLLIPYYGLVRDKIMSPRNPEKPISLGEFKGIMLDRLANQGLMRNLSLGSNFYLAGATKYYFQGMLTTDKKAALLSGDISAPDNWDREICKRLNIVIKILRNAYIDTVGTQFEQPEDFGELSLPRLLRKYNKKIEAELVNYVDEPEDNGVEEADNLNRDPNVGNDYTFDILYNFHDGNKYEQPTSPGSWCITYRKDMWDMYKNRAARYNGVHYVVFTKRGYENIERPSTIQPGFTREKPHDEYGNSMICYLQRNDSWLPTIITSRWNHNGPGGVSCEADNAYTVPEFCQITGVSEEDLKRIYEIWLKDNVKYATDNDVNPENVSKQELKAATISARRRLYYAQMIVNTGEKISTALEGAGVELRNSEPLFGSVERMDKSIVKHRIKGDNLWFSFITDKNNIIFDSMIPDYDEEAEIQKIYGNVCPGVYIVKGRNKCLVYNGRYHEFLTIGGLSVFKKIPLNTSCAHRNDKEEKYVFEVKQSRDAICLVSFSDLRPIRLPNGMIFFNNVTAPNMWYDGRQIDCIEYTEDRGPVIKIECGNDFYLFNIIQRKFIDLEIPKYKNGGELTIHRDVNGTVSRNEKQEIIDGYYALSYGPYGRAMLFNFKNERISIYGETEFSSLKSCGNIIMIGENASYWSTTYKLYDPNKKRYIALGNNPIKTSSYYGTNSSSNKRFFLIRAHDYRSYFYIYDKTTGLLLKNTFGYPNDNEGSKFLIADDDEDKFTIWKREFSYWDVRASAPDNLTYDERERFVDDVREKCIIDLDTVPLKYFPNSCPINNETASAESENAINEQRINRIVSEVLKKYL